MDIHTDEYDPALGEALSRLNQLLQALYGEASGRPTLGNQWSVGAAVR